MRGVLFFVIVTLLASRISASEAIVVFPSGCNAKLDIAPTEQTGIVEFPVENIVGRQVVIESKSKSCGCFSLQFPEPVFAPGKAGVVRAIVSSGEYVGRKNESFTLAFRIVGSDQILQESTFIVSVDYPKLLEISPSALRWNPNEDLGPQWMRVRCENAKQVNSVEVVNGPFSIISEAPLRGTEIAFQVVPRSESGQSSSGLLKIKFTDLSNNMREKHIFMLCRP